MNYRRFGDSDLEVSEICFGPMRFAEKEVGEDERSEEGRRALERAIERGVNFIHSSYEYGTRWSMERVLKEHPKRGELHHIIKVPVPDWEDGGRFDAGRFRMRIEEALKDLHTERIAVVQHLQRTRPNEDEARIADIGGVHEELGETFERLREEGKVGYLTTFPYTPGFAGPALATGDFSGMVAYYNLIEMEMAEFFPAMGAQGKGFFCIRPFMGGLLTDARAERGDIAADDRYNEASWDSAYERLSLLKSSLGLADIGSWTAFATKFALIHPMVTSLIVGLNSVEQVDGVLDAADGNYPDRSLWDKALSVFQQHGMVNA
jgi:aryl-alcohol dehydrogenase-like predicted oxidoreductase